MPTRAALADGVLRLSASPSARGEMLWPLLVANGRLPAASKYAVDARSGESMLVVEVALDNGDSARAVADACDLLLRAESVAAGSVSDVAAPPAADGAESSAWLDGWSDGAWDRSSLGDGRYAVDYAARDGTQRVVIGPVSGGLRCEVELTAAAPDPVRRQAQALLLLTACDLLPFARAAADEGERDVMRFEALLPATASGAAVERTVMTLAAAGDQFGPECRALSEDLLAGEYAAARRCPRAGLSAAGLRAVPNVLKRLLKGG
jgi:hypothetical protein